MNLDIDELAGRVAGARLAARARTSTAVDPYVVALADLADLVNDYFRTRYRFDSCGHAEVHAASIAFTNAEADLLNVVIPGRHAVSSPGHASPRPRWWRRIWPWGRR